MLYDLSYHGTQKEYVFGIVVGQQKVNFLCNCSTVDYCESDKLWCHESFVQYLALVSLYLGLLAEDFGCLLHQ
ncbi:Homoserine O-succinyltransferase [Frankliniella fusca]|uniref:Homoserine O-succinyltransferase n=1 Tax=Frankliniella fusca TaxID=407009 RepID=A0AAE1HEU8_9NEOP|nr:Homoserine O-succinyltransferase [Frankliniella fusca]